MLTVHTRIGYTGQEVYAFELPSDHEVKPEDVSLEGNVLDTVRDRFSASVDGRENRGMLFDQERARLDGRTGGGIRSVSAADSRLRVEVVPFPQEAVTGSRSKAGRIPGRRLRSLPTG